MCVIIAGTHKLPTTETIAKCWSKNSDGAGIAWNDGKTCHYIKGIMKLQELQSILKHNKAMTKNQYTIHFRMTSIGSKSPALTHGFVVDKYGMNPLVYNGTKPILMHNGHDSQIIDKMVNMHINNRIKLPAGEFSDSRAVAVLASYNGNNICQFVSGKFIIMEASQIFRYGSFEEKDGLLYSNMSWTYTTITTMNEDIPSLNYGYMGRDSFSSEYLRRYDSELDDDTMAEVGKLQVGFK
jgi:hypothetical protein